MDWPQEKDKKHVANGFHGFFLIEHSNRKNGVCGRELFLSKFCNGSSRQNLPLSFPAYSSSPSSVLLSSASQTSFLAFSSSVGSWSQCHSACVIQQVLVYLPLLELLLSYLPAPCLVCRHCLVSILSLSFSFPSPVSPGSSFSIWLLNACVVGVKSLFNTISTVSLCHSNLQFLEGEIPCGSSIQIVKPTRDRTTSKCSCQFQISFLNTCKLQFLLKLRQM